MAQTRVVGDMITIELRSTKSGKRARVYTDGKDKPDEYTRPTWKHLHKFLRAKFTIPPTVRLPRHAGDVEL